MPDETDTLIQEHLKSLPDYVREAFTLAKPFEKIRKISADFNLHVDEAEKLEQEVLLVMLGLADPDTFIDETSKTFGLSDEDSIKLVDRVSLDLFMPIRDAMQRYMEELAEKEPQKSAPSVSSVEENAQGPQETAGVPAIFHTPLSTPKSAQTPISPTKEVVPILQTQTKEGQTPAINPVNEMLSKPQSSTVEKITVGISPAKSGYKTDPYLEPPI